VHARLIDEKRGDREYALAEPVAHVKPFAGAPGVPSRHRHPHIRCDPHWSHAALEASGSKPVLFDSGTRSGADVIKALALGAKAVGVGRPYVYGLAIGGAEGVRHVLRCFLAEADLLMAIDGYPTLKDLVPEALRRVR